MRDYAFVEDMIGYTFALFLILCGLSILRSYFELSLEDYQYAYKPYLDCPINFSIRSSDCIKRTDYFISLLDDSFIDGRITYGEYYYAYWKDAYNTYSLNNLNEALSIQALKASRGIN